LDKNSILDDVHGQGVAGASIQVIGGNGYGTDVNSRQDMSVCRVSKSVIDRSPVVQVFNENGYIVVRISAGIATGAGPEKDD